jgi:hypothetical protein
VYTTVNRAEGDSSQPHSVVAGSILLHGISARPLLSWYERRLSGRREK